MGRKSRKIAALALAALGLASGASMSAAQVISRDIFYTRWNTNNALEANVKKCVVTYDRDAGTMVISDITPLARTNGADGIVFAPDGQLLIGGQGSGFMHKVDPTLGTFTSELVNGGASFHIVVDPSNQKAWTAGLPGTISEVPLAPFGAGTPHAVSGSVAGITDLQFVGNQVFYTSSMNSGNGSFGTIDMTTFTTTQILGPALESAHGMRFDPFTGHLLLCGGGKVIQIDPANPSVIISTLDLLSYLTGPVTDRFLDQLAPDGQGLVYIAANDGTFFVVDYAATGIIGDGANVIRSQILDTFLDDIAPLVGTTGECCPIGTGSYDGQNSQASQIPRDECHDHFAYQAADDFYLCPGHIYRIHGISATFATNQTLFPKAGVKVYEDCDGKPGAEIIFSSSNPDDRPVVTVTPTGQPYDSNLQLMTVEAKFPNLWLRGGKSYWVSFYGTGCIDTVWAWTTAGNGTILGRPAHFRTFQGTNPFSPWEPLDECCIGCTDLAFCVDAEECKILQDNGTYQRPQQMVGPAPLPVPGTTSIDNAPINAMLAKSADDFVVPPCDPVEVCYIEAYIITNCENARLDIYEGECNLPQNEPAIYTLTPKRYVKTGVFYTVPGPGGQPLVLEVICLQFWGDRIVLDGGRNYWVSAYGKGSGSANQRAYFAWNSDGCTDTCLIHFNDGAVRGPGFNLSLPQPLDWHSHQDAFGVKKNFAFTVAIHVEEHEPDFTASFPACPADFNNSGGVSVDDLFMYLNAWFTGCP